MLRPPLEAIHPDPVGALPRTMPGGIMYQAKLDGWRALAFIDEDGVVLQARSHRILTPRFPEILPALATRPPGTVLDGEIVAWRDGFDFQALARPPGARRRAGIAVSYFAFDLLCQDGQDIRTLALRERWPRLLTLLEGAPDDLQPVLATLERAEAEAWMRLLAPVGMEGIVCKAMDSTYRTAPGAWVKYRHADTTDAELIDTLGPAARPHALRVRLPDGREITTLGLTGPQSTAVAKALTERADDAPALLVELALSGDRHIHARFVRLRPEE